MLSHDLCWENKTYKLKTFYWPCKERVAFYSDTSNRKTIIFGEKYGCIAGYIISGVHLERNSIAKLDFLSSLKKKKKKKEERNDYCVWVSSHDGGPDEQN